MWDKHKVQANLWTSPKLQSKPMHHFSDPAMSWFLRNEFSKGCFIRSNIKHHKQEDSLSSTQEMGLSTPSLKTLSLMEKIQGEHRSLFCQLYPCNEFISQSCVVTRTWSLLYTQDMFSSHVTAAMSGWEEGKIIKRAATLVSFETNGNAGSLQAKSGSGSCSGPSTSSSLMATLHTYSPR